MLYSNVDVYSPDSLTASFQNKSEYFQIQLTIRTYPHNINGRTCESTSKTSREWCYKMSSNGVGSIKSAYQLFFHPIINS